MIPRRRSNYLLRTASPARRLRATSTTSSILCASTPPSLDRTWIYTYSKSFLKGPKLTPQREAVYEVIRERDDHPTAGDIFEAARKRLPGISYATVYNSLRYLKEAGLVHEISFGDCASRYDGVMERHDHAICNQ